MDASLIDDCVHCGFCLPTCPTYELWHEEMDSPRGRIWLMKATLDGTLELNRTVAEHFDRCLGCMACLTSCPSGVQYDRLIELARERVEQEVPRPVGERLLRVARLRRLPAAEAAEARAPFSLAARARAVPAAQGARAAAGARRSRRLPRPRPSGERIARVGLLTGCVQSVLFGEVNRASARVLAALRLRGRGARTTAAAARSRSTPAAARRGSSSLAARPPRSPRPGCEMIVTNAAGCGSHLKDAHLDLPVVDISEALTRGQRARAARRSSCASRSRSRATSATPSGCATSRARCCARSPGVELVEPAEQELCCGSAGIYNLVQPDAARTLGDRKAANVLATEPDLYVSANPGCLLQVSAALRRAGRPIPAAHPVELLDASIRGVAPPTRI